MNWKSKSFGSAILLAGMAFSCRMVRANDIYIAQTAVGSANGSSCANSYAMSYFNSSLNWNSVVGSIGPGTTVHLCGTFNAPAGADGLLQFHGGGALGNPIALVAESGLVMQAPYWGEHGAIVANGVNNIVIDGKHAGTIQGTANGTRLANQAPPCGTGIVCTSAINVSNCDNCQVQNWTIANLYVNVPPNDESPVGEGSFGIFYNAGNNISISGNTVHDAKWCLFFGYYPLATTVNARIFGNTAYHCDHGVAVYSDDRGAILNGLYIYGNTLYDGANWDDTANGNHHDGIHISPVQDNTSLNNAYIYNNYIYGDWGFGCNTFIYVEAGFETITNANVFNNLLVNTSPVNTCANGLIQDWAAHNSLIANNTLIGPTTAKGQGIITEEAGQYHSNLKNNIITGFQNAIYVGQESSMPASDYNLLYNNANIAFVWGSSCCEKLAEWMSQPGAPDTHTVSGNPNLNGAYAPQAGSAALHTGTNLTSLGIGDLNSDKAGVKRPAGTCSSPGGSTCWDLGAYQSPPVGNTKPNPPALLTIQVH